MNKKLSLFIGLFFLSIFYSLGQAIKVDVKEIPLNQVLINIRDHNNIQISFNDQLLSQYKISKSSAYSSPEKAIKALISEFPLSFEKRGDVFIIYPSLKKEKKQLYCCAGQVLEYKTQEPLPFSHLVINGKTMASDLKGSFTYTSSDDTVFSVRCSHLGYYILDTIVEASTHHKFQLIPSSVGLSEIVVKNNPIEKSTQIGDQPGVMKINHKVATFLPGYSDNSLLNLLRLHPGILASGEQTNDLIIWGSYEGHSQVLFDNFTMYGLKNFNDNISAFNPLVAKDIEVYKGGFDVRFGDRVGGIVNATGKNGSTFKPSYTLNINNMTLNGMAEIPLGKKSSLLMAARQTYYNLYDQEDLNLYGTRNGQGRNGVVDNNNLDLNVYPDYMFHDANIKFTSNFENGDLFYISLYGGSDDFSYDFNEELLSWAIHKNTREENRQLGGSLFYGRTWTQGSITNFTINYSSLQNDYIDNYYIQHPRISNKINITDEDISNKINEFVTKVDHQVAINESHSLTGGFSFIYNDANLLESTPNDTTAFDSDEKRLNLFILDEFRLNERVDLKIGLRFNYPTEIRKLYIEPRISASIDAGNHWKVNAAWGKYNQFVSKSSMVDDNGNYRYLWMVCDDENIPVLSAHHFVLGTSYHHNDFTFSLEGYRKKTSGLTRYVNPNGQNIDGIYQGEGRSYGLDFFVKKDFNGHSAWVSYSLSKTEELFDYFPNDIYLRAPQDQRHEIKFAGLWNLDPFFLSGNYVYGSGFPLIVPIEQQEVTTGSTYNRFDASFIYKFLDKKLKGEIGLSILNLFNSENIKQSNFEKVPDYQTNTINIHAEAIPFTPTLFLKLTY